MIEFENTEGLKDDLNVLEALLGLLRNDNVSIAVSNIISDIKVKESKND